eukprot:gb/GECG01003064.1/.p1 GENE.gb/GECG01003064.1/~~gb/GECG01003064.1/.p1  ORF type:complete len:143 (+),score=12.39 gb/GECG01003064.1/:1-429(+)
MPTEDPSTGSQASTGQSEAPGQFDMEATQDLIIATMDPSVEDAKEAISRGANVNHKNEHGMSPLLIACGGIGPRQMLKELLQAGANVNIRDKVRIYIKFTSFVLVLKSVVVFVLRNIGHRCYTQPLLANDHWLRNSLTGMRI